VTIRPPAATGDRLADVDTPALIVDLDIFERNLKCMADNLAGKPLRLRPHSKSHKCPEIARRQVALGAVGVCCQKVSEAEIMVEGGIENVLVSNEIVGLPKLDRLADLNRRAWVGVCVDDAGNVDDLEAAAARADAVVPVLVEIDVGCLRCGVPPGEAAVELARQVAGKDHLRFAGLQAYQGRAQHIRGFQDREEAIDQATLLTRQTLDGLAKEGLTCDIVGGGGSGTYQFEAATGVYNELQPGSYIFMDADYGRNLAKNGELFREFEFSLHIYTTVMSRPMPDRAIVDAGLKAFSVDSGMPTVFDIEDASLDRASDEHGSITLRQSIEQPKVGDKIRLIPGHCDPTVNLYDWIVCIRNGVVEEVWPVSARGALL